MNFIYPKHFYGIRIEVIKSFMIVLADNPLLHQRLGFLEQCDHWVNL